MFDQALLLVDEAGRVAGEQYRRPGRGGEGADCPDRVLRALRERRFGEAEVGVGDLFGSGEEGSAVDDAADRFDPFPVARQRGFAGTAVNRDRDRLDQLARVVGFDVAVGLI